MTHLPSPMPHPKPPRKPICQLCFSRPAIYKTFRNPNKVKSDAQHDLCFACERSRKNAFFAGVEQGSVKYLTYLSATT